MLWLVRHVDVWFATKEDLVSAAKSAQNLMRAVFDEETLGKYPKALCLNGRDEGEYPLVVRDEVEQRV